MQPSLWREPCYYTIASIITPVITMTTVLSQHHTGGARAAVGVLELLPGFCQPEVPQAWENCGERSGKSQENTRTWEDDIQELGKGYKDKKLHQQGSRWSYGGPFLAGGQPAQVLVVSRLRNPGLWRLVCDVNPHVICHWGKLKLTKHGVWCRQGGFIYIIHAKVTSTWLPDGQHKALPSVRLST